MYDIRKREIEQREQILNKVRDKIKISPDERMWLMTHSVYNERWGLDCFNIVVEQIDPNKWFLLKIKVESVMYEKRIIPIISAVPASKGKIVTDLDLYDYNGNLTSKKYVKMLGLELNNDSDEYEVKYFSDLGILSVAYECDYFDVRQNIIKRESSSTRNTDFAIKRQVVDDHTIKYYCKSPIAQSFDSLVFSIQWVPIH